jgi:hypothetical protein
MTDTSAVTTPATDSSMIVLAAYRSVVRSGLRMLFELDHDLVDH